MSIVTRAGKTNPLTWAEMDANFSGLADGSLLTGLAASSGSSLVGFIQSGTGPVATTEQDELRAIAVRPEQFGATGGADDTLAFTKFQTWAIALSSGYAAKLTCLRGRTYSYTNPGWPIGIRKLIVDGNGCTFQNIATNNNDKELLITACGLNANAGTLGAAYSPVNFYQVNSTTVGGTSVTTTTAGNAGNFVDGEWVMVGSFDQQFGGQPPNLRYFEYVKVSGAPNAGTGVVTLDRGLKYAHLSNFPYLSTYTNGSGRASIYKLEQGSIWDIEHEYNDITFSIQTPAGASSTIAAFLTGRHVVYNRCTAAYFLPTILGHGKLNACIQTGAGEVDKLVTLMEYDGGEYRGQISSATSCDKLRATGTKFLGGYLWSPKACELLDCEVPATTPTLKTGPGFCERLLVRGGSHQALPIYTIGAGQTNSITIDASNVVWATPNLTVLITNTARQQFVAACFVGQLVHVSVSSGGSDLATGVMAKVISITGGDGTATIQLDFNAALAGTEQLTVHSEPTNVDIQGVYVGGDNYLTQRWIKLIKHKYTLTSRTIPQGLNIAQNQFGFGRVIRVTVDIIRPYTGGTAGNCLLSIYDTYPQFQTRINKTVDMKTVGRRESSLTGNSGWTGAAGESAGANLTSSGSINAWMVSKFDVAGMATMAGTTDQLPIVEVEIEFEHPHYRHSGS